MQIGNFNLNLESLGMGNLGSGLMIFVISVVIFLILGGIGLWIFFWIRNKKVYITPIKLIRLLDNGTKKEMNGLKGGKVMKGGVSDFAVKIPKTRKPKNLGYTPDFSKADANGTLVFITSGDGTLWQQVSERIDRYEEVTMQPAENEVNNAREQITQWINSKFTNETEEQKAVLLEHYLNEWFNKNYVVQKVDLVMKPIPTEVKTVTVNNLANWRSVLEKNKLTAFTIAIGAFIIMVIAHLISLYIQTKVKCPLPA